MKTTVMNDWLSKGYFKPTDVAKSLVAMMSKNPTMPWTNEIEGLELSDAVSSMFVEVCQGTKTPEQAVEFLAEKYEQLEREGKIIIPTL
jgi:ABC-type glycerol-3-phosphate transport system substrate-binding protein